MALATRRGLQEAGGATRDGQVPDPGVVFVGGVVLFVFKGKIIHTKKFEVR